MIQLSLLPSFQALQRFLVFLSLPPFLASSSAAHGKADHAIHLVAEQTASGKISILLPTKKQFTAQEQWGIQKVVTEENIPFKRKGKKPGKSFILPSQLS